MTQQTSEGGERSNEEPAPDRPRSYRPSLKSFTITVRVPLAGSPLLWILMAAQRRGVPTRTYILERAIACAVADLSGERKVDLNSLENPEHRPSYKLRFRKRPGPPRSRNWGAG